MGRSFLPDFNEGNTVISAVTAPGTSLDVSDELGNLMERELMKVPEVTGRHDVQAAANWTSTHGR